MLTTACLGVTLATLALCCWAAYKVGQASHPRSEGYLAARADGYRAGIAHGEKARRALQARIDTLEAALDEMGEQHDRAVARRFVPEIVRTVDETYDNVAAMLPDHASRGGGR